MGNYLSTEPINKPVHAPPNITQLPTGLIIYNKLNNVFIDSKHLGRVSHHHHVRETFCACNIKQDLMQESVHNLAILT